jgi:hypothetical protein
MPSNIEQGARWRAGLGRDQRVDLLCEPAPELLHQAVRNGRGRRQEMQLPDYPSDLWIDTGVPSATLWGVVLQLVE